MRCGYRVGNQLRYVRGAMLTTPFLPLADNDPSPGRDRMLCGWRLASALPLPDLPPWIEDERAADLTIDFGSIPDRLPNLAVDRPLVQIAADGTCRFGLPGVAAYMIDPAGTRVIIDPAAGASATDVRLFLFGSVFAVLCFRRGLLPLHASCVRIGNAAVAFAGPSGIGKSSLAASFLRHGRAVLADDVTVVDATAPEGPRVLPTFPRIKLWRDALERMGLPIKGLERTRPAFDKYNLPITSDFCAEALPLAAVIHLDFSPTLGAPKRLGGVMAVERTQRNLYRQSLANRLGAARRLMPAMLRTVQAPGGVWTLAYVGEESSVAPTIAAIEDLFGR